MPLPREARNRTSTDVVDATKNAEVMGTVNTWPAANAAPAKPKREVQLPLQIPAVAMTRERRAKDEKDASADLSFTVDLSAGLSVRTFKRLVEKHHGGLDLTQFCVVAVMNAVDSRLEMHDSSLVCVLSDSHRLEAALQDAGCLDSAARTPRSEPLADASVSNNLRFISFVKYHVPTAWKIVGYLQYTVSALLMIIGASARSRAHLETRTCSPYANVQSASFFSATCFACTGGTLLGFALSNHHVDCETDKWHFGAEDAACDEDSCCIARTDEFIHSNISDAVAHVHKQCDLIEHHAIIVR